MRSPKGRHLGAARWLAKNQNESDLIGGVNISTVNKQVASVLVDMTSAWTIGYSLGLGTAVLQELRAINRLHKTAVEQAGFAVLKGQGIPSILVETLSFRTLRKSSFSRTRITSRSSPARFLRASRSSLPPTRRSRARADAFRGLQSLLRAPEDLDRNPPHHYNTGEAQSDAAPPCRNAVEAPSAGKDRPPVLRARPSSTLE